MKTQYFIILFLIFSSCSNLKYLTPFEGYANKPKEVELQYYIVSTVDSIKTIRASSKSISYYDRKGRLLKTTSFKANGPSTKYRLFTYDKFGNLTEVASFNNTNKKSYQLNYYYNKQGQIIKKENIRENSKMVTNTVYDQKKRMSKSIMVKNDSIFFDSSMFKYNKDWQEIELTSYLESGEQKSRIEFFYDKKKNQILSKWYRSDNSLKKFYETTFNDKGDKIAVKRYNFLDGKTKLISHNQTDFIYDKYGNCIEKRYFENGVLKMILKYKFRYKK